MATHRLRVLVVDVRNQLLMNDSDDSCDHRRAGVQPNRSRTCAARSKLDLFADRERAVSAHPDTCDARQLS